MVKVSELSETLPWDYVSNLSFLDIFKTFSHTKMEISINCITINSVTVRFIPETTHNTDDDHDDDHIMI